MGGRNCGGKGKASPSVLKEVRIVHRIGKKIRSRRPTRRGREPIFSAASTCRAIASGVQVLADDAHQEERDDVGEDHRDHAAGRGAADVVVEQRLRVDQEGDVGGRSPDRRWW